MNGKIHDNPLTDLVVYGLHPFPADIEEMLPAKLRVSSPNDSDRRQ